jgi:antitoxin ParD1/3/4
MTMTTSIRKTITLSDQQDNWIKGRIASGAYANDSEYVRDLIRRDQEQNLQARSRLLALKVAIKDGLDSGGSAKSVHDIMKAVERKLKAHGRL